MKIKKITNLFVDAFFWFRYVGWIYLSALIALTLLVYGAYTLAIATPLVKISLTLGGIIIYNLAGRFSKTLPSLNYLILAITPITIYGLILSAFVVPWFITIGIITSFVLATTIIIAKEKKFTIPSYLVWIRNIVNLFTLIYLAYHIITLL